MSFSKCRIEPPTGHFNKLPKHTYDLFSVRSQELPETMLLQTIADSNDVHDGDEEDDDDDVDDV